MNDINERLVVLRKNLGISQLEFANNLNIKRQTVAHLEGKNVAFFVELLKSICQFYKVNETWLLYGTGEMLTDAKPYTAVDLHKVTNDGVIKYGTSDLDRLTNAINALRDSIDRLAKK